ncbi:MAG: hypothetical protein ACKVQW_01110 [Pyrinomonadaceae bacterium]
MRVIVTAAILIVLSILASAQNKTDSCPAISVIGPSGPVGEGKLAPFTARVESKGREYTLEYIWSTSAGKIASGQGTTSIEVVMPDSHSLTVTVEVKGIPTDCPNTASESMIWDPAPQPTKLDEFVGSLAKVPAKRFVKAFEKAKYDDYAQVYILISGAGRNPGSSIRKKRQILLKHITITFRYDTQRVTFVDVDKKRDDRVTIWLVPAGASPPQP